MFMKFHRLWALVFVIIFSACSGVDDGSESSISDSEGTQSTSTQKEIGNEGGFMTLPSGESLTIPSGSVSSTTNIVFNISDLSETVDEEIQSYLFTSDSPIEEVTFTIPIKFSDIESSDDLHAVYISEEGDMKTLDLEYDTEKKSATVELSDNWTFPTLSPTRKLAQSTDKPNFLIVMKAKASSSSTSGEVKLIPMPYYEQPGNTCWATSTKMLTHGLVSMSDAKYETDDIYALMGSLKVGLDDGFNGFWKGASLAKVADLQYKNYFLWSSIKDKLIEELDDGHPLIYMGTFKSLSAPGEKITHAVLIVGYKYEGDALSFVVHDPRNLGNQKMYTIMSWKDMQLIEYFPTEAVTLFWSDTKVSTPNSTLTLGIPTHGELGDFYFEGQKTDELNSVRYYLQFTTEDTSGYIWSDEIRSASSQTTFQENVSQLRLKLPVYNSGGSSANAFITVEVYEKGDTSNKVTTQVDLTLGALSESVAEMELDLSRLTEELESMSECVVSIKLSEDGTISTWHIFDGFYLSPTDKKIDSSLVYTKPSQSACETYGTWDGDECGAEWENAKKICTLPTYEDWKNVLLHCGAVNSDYGLDTDDLDYSCLGELGYGYDRYWSSTEYYSSSIYAFEFDRIISLHEYGAGYVRCK